MGASYFSTMRTYYSVLLPEFAVALTLICRKYQIPNEIISNLIHGSEPFQTKSGDVGIKFVTVYPSRDDFLMARHHRWLQNGTSFSEDDSGADSHEDSSSEDSSEEKIRAKRAAQAAAEEARHQAEADARAKAALVAAQGVPSPPSPTKNISTPF